LLPQLINLPDNERIKEINGVEMVIGLGEEGASLISVSGDRG
jgi:hypothetical protein